MKDFMPDGLEDLKTDKKYIRLSKIPEEGIKIRIVMKPIVGWIDWTPENKPLRFRSNNRPRKPIDPLRPIKSFWTFYVWDYAKEDLFVMEVTQKTILQAIANYANDENWGDYTKYDIRITKKGALKETEYFVTPLPHKPIGDKILAALASTPVRLEALYDGGDPWNDLDADLDIPVIPDASNLLTETQCAQLDDLIMADPEGEKVVKDMLKIARIYDMPADQFDRTITYFNNRKGANKNAKSKVA